MSAVILRCPNGHELETTRRPPHMPCMTCAGEGRGVVSYISAPPPPSYVEPREHVRVLEPAPALVASAEFRYDCGRDGHRFLGGICLMCIAPAPLNPATPLAAVVFVLVLLAAMALGARAARADVPDWAPPSVGETVAMVAVEGLIAIDVAQTVRAHRTLPGFYEVNPLFSGNPSTERIILFGAAGGLAAAGLWLALPPKLRLFVPAIVGIAELIAVTNNARAVGLFTVRF